MLPPRNDPGLVEKHVQPPDGLDGIIDQILAIGLVPEILALLERVRLFLLSSALSQSKPALVGGARNHTIAVDDEMSGNRMPDTSGRSCYHCGFLFDAASHS